MSTVARLRAQVAADRVALEVPGDVLADVAAAALLAVEELDEQLGVPAERRRDLPERRVRLGARRLLGVDLARARAERRREVAEQPRAPEAAAADDDAVAAGLVDHADRVGRRPDVAVAEHRRAGDRLFELGDRGPVGVARVELGRRAGVQRDGGDAGALGGLARPRGR